MSIAKIVTFNSRNVWMWSKEGINCFIFRAGLIYEKVNKEKPDVTPARSSPFWMPSATVRTICGRPLPWRRPVIPECSSLLTER